MNIIANNQAIPPEVSEWCARYSDFTLTLAETFLIVALLTAIIETVAILWPKLVAARKAPDVEAQAARLAALPAVDPVKLLEALKGLLETLKGLPAWIAIFLAGLALLWMAAQRPDGCPVAGANGSDREANANRTAGNPGNRTAPGNGTTNAAH